jgi:hypothetical protein
MKDCEPRNHTTPYRNVREARPVTHPRAGPKCFRIHCIQFSREHGEADNTWPASVIITERAMW